MRLEVHSEAREEFLQAVSFYEAQVTGFGFALCRRNRALPERTTARRTALALVVGVVPTLYIVVGGFLEIGVPPQVDGWIVGVAQFLAVSLAVAALVAPFRGLSLTIGSSDRRGATSVNQGEGRRCG